MNYAHLKQWVNEQASAKLQIVNIHIYEDSFLIKIAGEERYLQVSLNSQICAVFWTKHAELYKHGVEYATLKNHLAKGVITDISIAPSDRVIEIEVQKTDIYGERNVYALVCELNPRYPNLIFCKKNEDNRILDCWRKISLADNPDRQVLPGTSYEYLDNGFIPQNEAITYPLYIDNNGKIVVSEVGLAYKGMNSVFTSLFYLHYWGKRLDRQKNEKQKQLKKVIKCKEKKLEKLQVEMDSAHKEVQWKNWGELLSASYQLLKSGLESIELTDYYQAEPYPLVTIPLKVDLYPRQNIERYFKLYKKAKNGRRQIAQHMEKTIQEIEDLKKDIFELETIESVHAWKQAAKKKDVKTARYKKLRVNDDWEIFIGRTSRENDFLTTRLAKAQDWWFHTRVFQGTHIILRNYSKKTLPDNLRIICAGLAAYYSRAKKSSNVPVDYTMVKYVRKPHGSAPGYVIYTNQKTLYIDPLSMREAAAVLHEQYPINSLDKNE